MPAENAPLDAPELRNTALADALQTTDIAAVAFALRHGPTVVPLDDGDPGDVWTYRDPRSGDIALLLFSDAARVPPSLPARKVLLPPDGLPVLLDARSDIGVVYLDVAGPHPMRAAPAELRRALDA